MKRIAMQSMYKVFLKKFSGVGVLFHFCVSLPTILAIVYFGFFASDVYISESRFVVRSPNKSEASNFGVLLKSVGYSSSGEEIYAANDYLQSRDALRDIDRNGVVEKAYSSPRISLFNRFNPLGFDGSFEALYQYFSNKVSVRNETSTSITTLQVRAYTARDAKVFNEALLSRAEELVNHLNTRAQTDLVASASKEVKRARNLVAQTSRALARYRDNAKLVDPEKQAGLQLQMVSKLQDELIAARIQRDQIRALASDSSELGALDARIAGLKKSIAVETAKAAGGDGNGSSLSHAAVEYQRLQLDQKFADKQLAATLSALEEARLDARRQQAYVERIVQPGLPDDALEPHRLRGIFATLIMGLMAWGILSMLLASVRDHME
ncbi:hypothetical protein [Novosphingobium beihaiensis]|uniref:Capsular polysaccharide transport system permease protein n=1 Tax=Novosphingobium beihaiensis TaxID=2930389 RepID=A0ABT0BTP5_9SPHN|nr:hypothetical protein [Novosphingobium beihaiensis]MCJ2188355.1 hypothetical protein [Novosphingobium beihaiensis]